MSFFASSQTSSSEVVDGGGVELARLARPCGSRGRCSPMMCTPNFSVTLSRSVSAQLPPCSAARSTIDRAVLHADDRARRDELRRGHAGDDGVGHDDVGVLRVLADERLLGREVGLAHLLGVPALALPRFVELELEELSAEALDLLLDGGARVERAHDRPERPRGGDGREAGDARADDEHLRGLDPPGRGHLAG